MAPFPLRPHRHTARCRQQQVACTGIAEARNAVRDINITAADHHRSARPPKCRHHRPAQAQNMSASLQTSWAACNQHKHAGSCTAGARNTSAQVSLHAAAGQGGSVQRLSPSPLGPGTNHTPGVSVLTRQKSPKHTAGSKLTVPETTLVSECLQKAAHMMRPTLLSVSCSPLAQARWSWGVCKHVALDCKHRLRCTEQQSSLVHVCSKPQGFRRQQAAATRLAGATNR